MFGFAARVWRAAARVIAESFGGKWLVETRDAAVLELGLEQAVVEAQGFAAWSWACRKRWEAEGRRGREGGRLSARAGWLVSFFLLMALLGCGAWWSCGRVVVPGGFSWRVQRQPWGLFSSGLRRFVVRSAGRIRGCGVPVSLFVSSAALCAWLQSGVWRWTRLFCF